MERTLVIIKPDAVKKRHTGEIIRRLEAEGYHIIGIRMMKLTRDEAENFYYVHRNKDFFPYLVDFMCSGSCVGMVLEGPKVISGVREFIGGREPDKAAPGSIRADFGSTGRENAVHASDSVEASRFEVNYFFPELAW